MHLSSRCPFLFSASFAELANDSFRFQIRNKILWIAV